MRKRTLQSLEEDSVEEPLINLTPLIDVVFVVLITFMLVAPMLNADSIDLAASDGLEKKELETSPISIAVRADNSIWYQGNKVTLAQLEKQLRLDRKVKPNATPQIIHDKQASFGTYQSLKNTLEAVGFERMDVALKP